PPALHRDLFIRRVQPAIFIQIPDDSFGCIANFTFGTVHVELPLKMVGEGRWSREKLLESRSVFFVFEFLRLVPGIEIVLKLATEVDFFKWIAGRVRGCFFTAFSRSDFNVSLRFAG